MEESPNPLPDNNPPEIKPPDSPENKPSENPSSPNLKAVEDLSWEIPGGQAVFNFFIREGKAVKNGWLAVLVIIGLTFWVSLVWRN